MCVNKEKKRKLVNLSAMAIGLFFLYLSIGLLKSQWELWTDSVTRVPRRKWWSSMTTRLESIHAVRWWRTKRVSPPARLGACAPCNPCCLSLSVAVRNMQCKAKEGSVWSTIPVSDDALTWTRVIAWQKPNATLVAGLLLQTQFAASLEPISFVCRA